MELLSSLSIDVGKVLNVYLIGSRIWNTARPDSDFDLIVVVKNGYNCEHSLHGKNVDATVMSINEFKARVGRMEFLETICTYLPAEHKLLENIVISPINVDVIAWKKIINYRISRDLAYANKNESKGKLKRAYKTRFHALMTLALGIQLIKNGKITDFGIVAKYYDKCWDIDSFDPIYLKLLDEFSQLP